MKEEIKLACTTQERENVAVKPADIKFVKACVQDLLADSDMREPPFNPERLASLRRIRVVKANLDSIDAMLLADEEGFIAKINNSLPVERQYFSCAHEIAHTFFYTNEKVLSKAEMRIAPSGLSSSHLETLCDIGAAELLMPYDTFKMNAARYNFTIHGLVPLAHLFRTSITATAIRLADVNPSPCIAAYWIMDKTPGSTGYRFRVKWAWGGRYFIRIGGFVSENSSIGEAFKSNIVATSDECLEMGDHNRLCNIESQGFNSGSNRYVISLIHIESERNNGY